ncbi:MAG: AsmA family protein [Candidatus Berkiellales bacterium]
MISNTRRITASGFALFYLRVLLWLVGLVVALAIIIPIMVIIFFNPNDYKPQINTYINEKTGLPLSIEGNIELKMLPWLGFNAKNITLAQAPSYGQDTFIQIDEIGFKIPIRELFKWHLQIESLNIKGLNVHLIKNKDGKTNLEYYSSQLKKTTQGKASSNTGKQQNVENPTSSKKLTFALTHFSFENANVLYEDRTKSQRFTLSNLDLKGKNNGNSIEYPINSEFDLKLEPNGKDLFTGHADLQGLVNLAKGAPSAHFDANVSLKTPHALWQNVKLSTQVDANLAKAITFSNIDLTAGGTRALGKANIPMASGSPVTFQINVDQLNVDDLLKASSTSKSTTAGQTTPSPVTKSENNTAKNSSRPISGDIVIGQLQAKNMTFTQVKASLKTENNLLKINPLQASLYQGKLNATITYDLNNQSHPTTVQGQIAGLQIKPLLNDLKQMQDLSGIAALDFNLAQSTTESLHGILKCSLTNGVVTGVDVNYYLKKAQALLKKEQLTVSDTHQTPFDSLTATLNLHQNVIYNNDLLILSPTFRVNGEGSLNLKDQTLEYKLQAWKQYTDGVEHPNAYPLAIRLKGPIQHPKVEPDLDLYLKMALERELKKQINKQITKGLNKLLKIPKDQPNGSGQTSDPQEQAPEKVQTPEEIIKKKVSKEVERGLKKIFKID